VRHRHFLPMPGRRTTGPMFCVGKRLLPYCAVEGADEMGVSYAAISMMSADAGGARPLVCATRVGAQIAGISFVHAV
jgi:hypothetical protein